MDSAGRDWHGNVGVVPDLVAPALNGKAAFDPGATVAFAVGPEIMMRFAVRALLAAGVPEDRVFLSMERDMQCAAALCGHCQLGPFLLCRDGPVLGYGHAGPLDVGGAVMTIEARPADRASPRWRSGSSPPATAASSPC